MARGDKAAGTAGRSGWGRARRRADRVQEFFRDYAGGVSGKQIRRLFDHDAAEAWNVLTRDQVLADEPEDGLGRFLFRARVFFLGLSYKLSPPRRLLFAAALVLTLVALFTDWNVRRDTGRVAFSLDTDPLLYVVAVGCLVFLLALELVDRVRVRDELEVARQLQQDLQPAEAPRVEGWRFAHVYRTANEVGGDFYDFPLLPDGRVVLAIGDASGHGMAAGLLMAIAHATLHTALDLDPDPVRVGEILNRALCRAGDRRAFMTFFYGLLDPVSGHLDYVCAGHPYPLLRRTAGTVEELGRGGLPLGMRPALALRREAAEVAPGDLLFLYTDGLPEAVDPVDRAYGFERLRQVVATGGGAEATRDRVLADLDRHRGERDVVDDVSVLVVARQVGLPPPPPPPPPPPAAPGAGS